MELAVHPDDANILLKDKNVLKDSVIEKYRLAGQVSQTCLQYLISLVNDSYHLGKRDPISASELCIMGDSYLTSSLQNVYKKGSNAVRERGISQPVTIELNDIVGGFAPELGDNSNCFFKPGDIVTISLGCHVDGYTSNLSHTIVIYPPGNSKPAGPLLGPKADAICAAHIATEAVTSLLGASLSPEKLPAQLNTANNTVTGSQIRHLVDSIAESYNCIVVPGSRVRRVRRFLAGQSEGIVAEKDYKGVSWSEADQELNLLQKSQTISAAATSDLVNFDKTKNSVVSTASAIPTDDFVVSPGEVYMIDIRMAATAEINAPGLVTLQTVDQYYGTNNDESAFHAKPSIFVRDFAVQYSLKLRASKQLISKIDKDLSVYPFKLAHTSKLFPITSESAQTSEEQLLQILEDIKHARLGLSELSNRRLCVLRPIQIAKFIPLPVILNASNPTGPLGYDIEKPTLPGQEIPLPRLGLTSLKIKSMMKNSQPIAVAREVTTVALNSENSELLRLTGGSKISKPSWVHSDYELLGQYKDSIVQLINLSQDKRFGIKIREVQPFKFQINAKQTVETMMLD